MIGLLHACSLFLFLNLQWLSQHSADIKTSGSSEAFGKGEFKVVKYMFCYLTVLNHSFLLRTTDLCVWPW